MEDIISDFRKHSFLSNFYMTKVEYDGSIYPSSEHAYQAAKTTDLKDREWICSSKSPAEAKKRGKELHIREDWDSVKVQIMEQILKSKFKNKELQQKLLDTGNAKLVEGNWWGDTFWGFCRGKGENMLGQLLMKIREELVDHEKS